ncbi:acyltransferase [Phenylobacterium sp.]|uniref:acyltransferase family protein n=1 Tax=Phenylobacterium sp. TaxID=1871053 RepID=UPI0030F3E725
MRVTIDQADTKGTQAKSGMAPSLMPWLDWLRFAAALLVVVAHVRARVFVEYGSLTPDSQGLVTQVAFLVTRLGHEAVLVFFVLSGFLVGGRAAERAARGEFRWLDYSLDRVSRIFVPLIPAVMFTVATMAVVSETPSIAVIAGNLLLLQGVAVTPLAANGPLWSLSYEGWFYVLCGAAMALPTARGTIKAIAASLLTLSLIVLVTLEPVYLLCWVLGAFAYYLRAKTLSMSETVTACFIIVISIAIAQLSDIAKAAAVLHLDNSSSVAAIILAIGVGLLIRNLSAAPVALKGLDGVGNRLADFSYSLYLFHYPVLFLAAGLGLQRSSRIDVTSLLTAGGLVVGLLAFCYVMYLLFERHTAKVRRWLRRPPRPAHSTAAPP